MFGIGIAARSAAVFERIFRRVILDKVMLSSESAMIRAPVSLGSVTLTKVLQHLGQRLYVQCTCINTMQPRYSHVKPRVEMSKKPFTTRIDPELLELAKKIAKAERRSVTAIIELAIIEYAAKRNCEYSDRNND